MDNKKFDSIVIDVIAMIVDSTNNKVDYSVSTSYEKPKKQFFWEKDPDPTEYKITKIDITVIEKMEKL